MTHNAPVDPAPRRQLLIPDLPISSADDDALGHKDVATLLARVLSDWLPRSEPLHIALYGPWGGGKSGVISLLKREISDDRMLKESVHLLDFSLWRFGAENVRRGLLLFLDGTDGLHTDTKIAERLSKASARTEARTSVNWWRFLRWMVVSIVFLVLYLTVPAPTPQSSLLHRLFGELIRLGIALPVALGTLFGLAKLDLQTQVSEGTSQPPPDRADQFKAEFEGLLTKARSGATSEGSKPWKQPQKLVLVFDDLDRVPPSLAWDVLTTVKTFMDAPHCIYIVPCDRDAVLQAMKSESGPHLEARAIDFLDKFFQVSFNLPDTYPREFRQISDEVCDQLRLPREVGAIAVAGFSRTPRALKVFLNQVSLLSEFISVRNERMGELPSEGFLAKVAKVHAIRVLWPDCGRAIAEKPALMEILEQRAQGIESQEKSDVADLATRLMIPTYDEFCRGLREFLVATLGTVVSREAQSAIKLSEAIWAEARGDLDNMSTYLATGDSDGVRRLFEKGGIARAVGFARDAFNSESQTATPEALVGWTAVLLQASFDAKMTEVSEEVVALAVEWASSPQVSPSLAKLPPESLVRAIASTSSHQALTAGRRLVDLAHSDQTSPLPDYTVTVLRALSANRGVLQERHSELGRQMRERLADLVTQNRQQVLLRVSTLSQGVSGGDWGFWWDQNLGSKLVESITGTGNSSEDSEIINYVARPEYEPSQQERQAAVRTSVRLFQQHASSGLDAFTNIGLDLVNRVALSGQPLPLMSEQDTEVFAAFITRLSDPDQKLTSLIPTVRLVSFSGASAQKVVLEKGLQQAMPAFSSQHLGKVLTVLVDVGLVAEEGWGASLLRRCVELRDAALFSTVAEKSRHPGAISSGLEAAFQTDQSFGDSLMGKIQAYCDSGTFADALDRRVAAAGPDVASTVRLVNAIQSLSQKPELQDSVWHTIATRIEQGVTDFSDPGNAQALRRAVNSTFLAWLPEADQRHLADFATAVVRGAQGQPNDPPETTQAKAEAGLVFEPICSEAQGATIANGVAHVLAWPSLSPTVVSILVSALTSRPRLLALVKDEALEAIAFTRDSRTDEGKAFLESLLQARPPKPPKPSKTSSKGKPGKDS